MQSTGSNGTGLSDRERLRQLVVNHVANGGTVKEACERFEFETGGAHKARTSMLKWYLFLRYRAGQAPVNQESQSTSEEPAASEQVAQAAPATRYNESITREEESKMPQPSGFNVPSTVTEDEIGANLIHSVSAIVEDRKQMKELLSEYRKQIEMIERKLRDSEDERRTLELKLEKKDAEVDRQQRLMLDHQYKYEQLQEEFEQMQTNHQSEHNRLQEKVNDLSAHYEELTNDYTRVRKESTREIERLEMQLRNSEMKNTQLSAKYEEIRKDNAALTRRVTDFAHQISGFMDPAILNQAGLAPVPIRSVVDNSKQEPEDRAKA